MAKKKMLVRGADNKLYLVSMTDPPKPLTEEDQKKVEDALPKLTKKLEDIVKQDATMAAASCNQHVQIIIPSLPPMDID